METLKITCITWNVETSWPETEVTTLLGLREKEASLPDIYIISLQEVKSQPQNVILDSLFEEPWTTAFRDVLGPLGYVRCAGERLQGLIILIFVLKKHLHHMRDVHTAVTRTGFRGFWGNKGAACVRFLLYGCSMCLVNSHLAPHDTGFEERCANYNYIVDNTRFPIPMTSNILFHDYVFWMGDFNYRLIGTMRAEEIVKMVLSEQLTELASYDELALAQKSGKAFGPLVEGKLSFPPTYKYQTNSTSFDLNRRPAWTDRILHQVHVDAYDDVKLGVNQLTYSSCPSCLLSDHKPVYSTYEIKTFLNHQERIVHFKNIKQWVIGGSNVVKYNLDADIETSLWDYIAMFKSNFTSVHQYVTFSYVPQNQNSEVSSSSSNPSSISSRRNFEVLFLDELVLSPGSYVLLYYSEQYNCFLGTSEPFSVVEKSPALSTNIIDTTSRDPSD